MRWFKHLTSARLDQDLQDLIEICGPEAYGVYWMIIEIIGSQLSKTSAPEYRISVKKWAAFCSISVQKFKKIVEFLSKRGKFSVEEDGNIFTIKCEKIVKYRDEYTSRK